MSKINDHDSTNNCAIKESDSFVSASQGTSKNVQEHDRLAVFVEYSDKLNYLTKSKKNR